MREKGRLVPWMIGMAAVAALVGAAAAADRNASIKKEEGGVTLTLSAPSAGSVQEATYEDLQNWEFTADSVGLKVGNGESYKAEETKKDGKTYTTLSSEGSCVTIEQLDSEPEPTLEVVSGSEETTVQLNMPSGRCSFCSYFNDRTFDPDEIEAGCYIEAPGSVCTHCETYTCPDPPPVINPDPCLNPATYTPDCILQFHQRRRWF